MCRFRRNCLHNIFLLCSETLRALPQALSIKRRIKEKVAKAVKNKSLRESANQWTYFPSSIGLSYERVIHFIKNRRKFGELWHGSIKEIEGKFGGSVGTYFKFLRFLFILNIILMIATLR